MTRSYRTVLRATGRYKFLPAGHTASKPKQPGDLVLSRTDRPLVVIGEARNA